MRLTPTAYKQLKRIDGRYADRILRALEAYEATGAGDIKKLRGRPEFRLRLGGYRAIFVMIEGEVVVQSVAVRGSAY